MEKVILAFDKPENCDKCRICARAEIYDYCAYLGASKGEFIYPNGYAELAIGMSNCPLRPMPESLNWKFINETTDTNSFEYGRCIGRQELIDEILEEIV